MTQNAENKRPGMRGWLRVLLVASLALNLLIIGLIGGAIMMQGKWKDRHSSRMDMMAGPLTRALSREDRHAIGREMRRVWGKGHTEGANRRAELAGLITDLKAVPFDPAAIAGRLETFQRALSGRIEMGQKLLLVRLTNMSDAERTAYADRLQQGLDDRRKGRSSQ